MFQTAIDHEPEATVPDADNIATLQPLWENLAISGNTKPMSQLVHQVFAAEEK